MITKRTVFTIDGDITGRVFDITGRVFGSRAAAVAAIEARHEGSKMEFIRLGVHMVHRLFELTSDDGRGLEDTPAADLYELETSVRALGETIATLAEARRLLLGVEKQKMRKRV